jgi:serine/threonine protein kinase
LTYLHDQGIVHGDLKGVCVRTKQSPSCALTYLSDPKANILIDDNGHARLTDFTLIRILTDRWDRWECETSLLSLVKAGKLQWASPELIDPIGCGLEDCYPTKESDCYALGMVAYEVLSGKTPFAQHPLEVTLMKVLNGERPSRPRFLGGELFTDDIWNTLEHCWEHYPCDRLNAREILLCLEGNPVPVEVIYARGLRWRFDQYWDC